MIVSNEKKGIDSSWIVIGIIIFLTSSGLAFLFWGFGTFDITWFFLIPMALSIVLIIFAVIFVKKK